MCMIGLRAPVPCLLSSLLCCSLFCSIELARFTKALFLKKSPVNSFDDFCGAMAALMRCRLCSTILPAPICKCPTSEFPICPSGSPTADPLVVMTLCKRERQSFCQVGVLASAIAFPLFFASALCAASPQPSSMHSTKRFKIGLCQEALEDMWGIIFALRGFLSAYRNYEVW